MSFFKLSLNKTHNRSGGTTRKPALDVVDLSGSTQYTIQLPLASSSSSGPKSTSRSSDVAEMLDEDNMAWGSPPKKIKHNKST
ncbi:uncharacterized protein LAESUDRAFT_726054 [Laetiporus sulphureus 93-53]|uniref:Uncharacterized protein n=1 Tax=Laetiporus sulphureus 93-53 TaxID=1314785 RepID=A0A165E4R0_9APHY|nr:uncharacterized protein LAESUDRAFT_726054 [Laetiporus sulphureus 93-53]KZT06236.1 hypothetical protein LAESUDRAFT_726054 [Laetiporus sulphureus 93-53]